VKWPAVRWLAVRRALLLLVLPGPAVAQPTPASLSPPVTPACISSPFGLRRPVGPHATLFHNGVDFPAAAGTWVHAVAAGSVVAIRRLNSSGLEVDLRHGVPGAPFLTRYAHLGTLAPALAGGRRSVAAGGLLGRVGRTGITYGTHLHFELHLDGQPVDPEPFFRVPRCASTGGAGTP